MMQKRIAVISAIVLGAALTFTGCPSPTSPTVPTNPKDPTTPTDYTFLFKALDGSGDVATALDTWNSGTTISDYSSDSVYANAKQIVSGTGWGTAVACIAFKDFDSGKLAEYTTLNFKIKTSDYTTVRVKVPEEEKEYALSSGVSLANGWIQMAIPLSDFIAGVTKFQPAYVNQFAIFSFGAGSMLVTDVALSGSGAVYKKAMEDKIAEAQTLLTDHTVGTEDGNVSQETHDALNSAIGDAQSFISGSISAQSAITVALKTLLLAMKDFENNIIKSVPDTLPPAPTINSANVISLLNSSGTYTDFNVQNWNPNWGQSGSITDATIAGKTIKLLDLKNYQGVAIDETNRINITGKTKLHMSIWTANGQQFSVYAISSGDEQQLLTGPITKNQWNDIVIDIATGDFTKVMQLKFTAATVSGGPENVAVGQYYLDNIYFANE
ncbi:hypothetical protein [Gracilinema caldarium]|uniref:hypothetical protein n=1 Tax=Gracilinema caldarium TaxID=215591 RepID=UPI0026EEB7E4|nr:hypothetical protein [Gracilinema caldarium]